MTDPLRILFLEDNAADAELSERILRKSGLGFESRLVQERGAFLAALDGFRPDVILADYNLPGFDGLQALGLVRERDANLPFIFLTGALGEEGAVKLLHGGANDYILKDRLARLPAALDHALEMARQKAALQQTEQAFQDSEERFRAIVETTPDWIWEVDAEGRYTYVSPASLSLLGHAPEGLLGRRPFDLMPPDEARRVDALLAEIVAKRQPFALFEKTMLRKNGLMVVLETSGTPILGPEGHFLGYRGIDRDITERKRHEATLLLLARRAAALLDLPRAAERMAEVDFMQFGLELAEQLTESRIAFIHFIDDDQEAIELVTWSRQTLDGYCQAVHKSHYPVREAGVWADALRQRQPVVYNEYLAVSHRHGLPEGHAELTRLISAPVMEGDLVRMLVGMGNKIAPYTDLDVETVQLIADTIWRIVRQRRTEDELRKLSLAVEQSPASIVITDLDARIEYANPAFTRVSGYNLDEARAENPRILQSGDTSREVYDDLWATLGRGDIWRGEFRNRRKDGTDYVELASISPVRQPDGRVTHYLAVKEDITDRKRADEELEHYRLHLEELVELRTVELAQAEERSRLILESSADGLFGEDLQGYVTFINPAACAMLGYAPEEVLGRRMHDLIHHTRPDGTPYPLKDCPVHGTLRHGRVLLHDEEVFWHADGHSFPVTYSSHPMYRDGLIVGVVVSFFDISSQKHTEAAREAALAEAERLARLKSEFLANMSHEIRTPLNAVLGFAQVGVRESDGRKACDFFRRILDSGQLLLGVVNDILDFSKIEAGKLTIEQGVIDLREVIERSLDLLRAGADDKGLDFRVEESEDLPATCRGDGLRLAQVLGNLLSNAIKFTARGEVVLRASREGQRLLFSVSDTGIGMTASQVAHLFRPFEQADGSITRRFGGTGLGLAITKRLVDMMAGEIRIWSHPGEGARFEVSIPLVQPQGSIADVRREVKAPQSAGQRQRLRGLVILGAEDNAANRLVLEELLNDEGCWLIQVENGMQAVERVRCDGGGAFDLVLMDIQMPIMDGFEATRRIRELAPELPIIGLTAHALQSERSQCLAAGMNDHVAKPVDLDRLVATIRKYARTGGDADIDWPSASVGYTLRSARSDESVPTHGTAGATLIDWSSLSARYQRHPDFLPRLLTSIRETNVANPGILRQAAARGEMRGIAFLAHTLKGTGGILLAHEFSELAAATEKSATEARSDTSRQALALADALDAILLEIEGYRHPEADGRADDGVSTGETDPLAAGPVDGAVLSDVLERLESLLAIDDTSANGIFEHFQPLLRQALGEQARQLGREIMGFEYQNALATLRAARDARMPGKRGMAARPER